VTVGYGDIRAYNSYEEVLCIFMMLLGVISFSFATGSIASIITSYDSKEAQLKEKISVLNDIYIEYRLDINLFNKLARSIKYDHSKRKRDFTQFIEELPNQLRIELALVMHNRLYSGIAFFKGKDKSMIAWLST
jgi:hypothetical protein